jgi:hypothetical protein
MIRSTSTNDPSPHVRQRALKCRVRTLSPFTYAVTPPEKGKAVRLVVFDYDQKSSVVRIDCFDRDTSECCPANAFSKPCAHVEAAVRRLLTNAKRQDKIQSNTKRNREIQGYARKVIAERLPGVRP